MEMIFYERFTKVFFYAGIITFFLFSLHVSKICAQIPVADNVELNNHGPREFKEGVLKSNNKGIPVLMYHSIGYQKGNDLRVPKEKFKEQMKYLKEAGFTTLTLDELNEFFQNNKPVPAKSVVITFDDGYADNYKDAYPVLKEYGFKAVIFVVSGWVHEEKNSYISSGELKELESNGIEIQCHTVNHNELSTLSYEKQKQLLKDSKEALEKLLNKKVSYLAYPFGHYNTNTIRAAKDCGYKMAFTIRRGISDKTDGILTLDRAFISAYDTMNEFKAKVSAN